MKWCPDLNISFLFSHANFSSEKLNLMTDRFHDFTNGQFSQIFIFMALDKGSRGKLLIQRAYALWDLFGLLKDFRGFLGFFLGDFRGLPFFMGATHGPLIKGSMGQGV